VGVIVIVVGGAWRVLHVPRRSFVGCTASEGLGDSQLLVGLAGGVARQSMLHVSMLRTLPGCFAGCSCAGGWCAVADARVAFYQLHAACAMLLSAILDKVVLCPHNAVPSASFVVQAAEPMWLMCFPRLVWCRVLLASVDRTSSSKLLQLLSSDACRAATSSVDSRLEC
jgi:hypothetical protein